MCVSLVFVFECKKCFFFGFFDEKVLVVIFSCGGCAFAFRTKCAHALLSFKLLTWCSSMCFCQKMWWYSCCVVITERQMRNFDVFQQCTQRIHANDEQQQFFIPSPKHTRQNKNHIFSMKLFLYCNCVACMCLSFSLIHRVSLSAIVFFFLSLFGIFPFEFKTDGSTFKKAILFRFC